MSFVYNPYKYHNQYLAQKKRQPTIMDAVMHYASLEDRKKIEQMIQAAKEKERK